MFPIKTDSPPLRFPIFTYLIVALNLFAFIHELSMGKALATFINKYGCTPYEITHFIDLVPHIDLPIYLTLITSLFLHGSWIHFLGNMWFLYIFGRNVEGWLGYRKFILFYLGCGVGASIVQLLFSPFSKIPIIGASGAIAGVLGGYFVLYPRTKVVCIVPLLFFVRIVELPAFLFLGFWVIWQLFSQMTIGAFSNIAFLAHIGGFFIGLFGVRWIKLKEWR